MSTPLGHLRIPATAEGTTVHTSITNIFQFVQEAIIGSDKLIHIKLADGTSTSLPLDDYLKSPESGESLKDHHALKTYVQRTLFANNLQKHKNTIHQQTIQSQIDYFELRLKQARIKKLEDKKERLENTLHPFFVYVPQLAKVFNSYIEDKPIEQQIRYMKIVKNSIQMVYLSVNSIHLPETLHTVHGFMGGFQRSFLISFAVNMSLHILGITPNPPQNYGLADVVFQGQMYSGSDDDTPFVTQGSPPSYQVISKPPEWTYSLEMISALTNLHSKMNNKITKHSHHIF